MKKKNANEELFNVLGSDIPISFLRDIPHIQVQSYSEANECVKNDYRFAEPEAKYLLPHIRRAKFEQLFRRRALDCGLVATVESTRKNANYTLVRAGRFLLTASFAHNEKEFVRPAHFRSQHAYLNSLLGQMDMFKPKGDVPPNDLYGIIRHGVSKTKSESKRDEESKDESYFLTIAIPSEDNKSWVGNYDLLDMIKVNEERINRMDSAEELDIAVPMPKRKDIQGGE